MRPLSILNSEYRGALHFLAAFLIIFLPIIGGLEWVLFRLGETWSYEKVLDAQQRHDILYSQRPYIDAMDYKIMGIKKTRPEIVAMGESPIMQLRQSHILGGHRFYNAGVYAQVSRGFDGILAMLRAIPENQTPRILILGLSPWQFNAGYISDIHHIGSRPSLGRRAYHSIIERLQIYDALLREKEGWFQYVFYEPNIAIGLEAYVKNRGFGPDGSFRYPERYDLDISKPKGTDLTGPKIINKTATDASVYFQDGKFSDQVLEKFAELMRYCHSSGIRVIGVLLPIRNDRYDAFIRNPVQSLLLKRLRAAIPPIMARQGDRFFDGFSPSSLGLSDGDFLDEIHLKAPGFEVIMARLQSTLYRSNSKPVNFIFFGDSIIERWPVNKFFSPAHMAKLGFGGKTSSQLAARFYEDVLGTRPAAVLILAGANDAMNGISPELTERKLARMVQLAHDFGSKVFLGTILPMIEDPSHSSANATIKRVNSWISHYCAGGNCISVDFNSALHDPKSHNSRYLIDGVHPNLAGYTLMSNELKKTLRENRTHPASLISSEFGI